MLFILEIRCNNEECGNYDNVFNEIPTKCDAETIINIITNWGTPDCDEDHCPMCDELGKVSITSAAVGDSQDGDSLESLANKIDDNTWSILTDIGEQLQNLMNDGLATKKEIMKFLDNEIMKPSWYHYGRDIASGSEGTGEMKVDNDQLYKYREMDKDEIVEDVEKLMSTDQWDHEVGTLLRKYNRSDIEELANDKDDWAWGYESFILDSLMSKDVQRHVECDNK